jgi:uncharacterized protein (TIGR03067 family)
MARMACLLVLLSPVLAAADDLKAMTKLWKPTSVVANGTEQFPDAKSRAAVTLVVKDGEYRLYIVLNADKDQHGRLMTAAIKLDEAKKEVELTVKDGPRQGKKFHGIYELKGDQLRLCYGPAEKPRPAKFESADGSFSFCETWTPEK